MSKLFKIFSVVFLILLYPLTANASCHIVIDGTELICHDSSGSVIEPFVQDGTTYVPVRAIAEAFDTTVTWDQETKTVHLGEKSGTPQLNEYINIYFDGAEFICLDANGSVVYPILKDSTTYLPIRGIGQLFGKEISWDNLTRTATLTTPPSSDAIDYLTDSVTNTENFPGLNVLVAVDATMSYNGDTVSTQSNLGTEPYLAYGFRLSDFLPENYIKNASYSGSGKYFLTVSPEKLSSNAEIQRILLKNQSDTVFSSIYITLNVQGGYLTDATMNFYGDLTYNGLVFDQSFTVQAIMQYPETFSFPNIPYPEAPHGDNEAFIPAQGGDNSDSTLISRVVQQYVSGAVSGNSTALTKLMHTDDYDSIFGSKSSAQIKTELANMKKELLTVYNGATEAYSVDSMVYIDATSYKGAERAAKAVVNIECNNDDGTWLMEIEIILTRIDGSWYIDSSMIKSLM